MDPFTIFMVASAIFSGAGAIESQRANKANRRAQDMQRQQQNLKAAQERRQSIRQMRVAQASAMQNAENQGVSGSSGAMGGQGSIVTQGAANLKFLDSNIGFANAAGNFLDQAAKHSSTAQMWGSLSNLAQTGMGMSAQPKWLTDFMGTTPSAPPTIKPVSHGNPLVNVGKGVSGSLTNNPWAQMMGYNQGTRPIY